MVWKSAIERVSRLPLNHYVAWDDFSRKLEDMCHLFVWLEDGIENYWHRAGASNPRGRKRVYSDVAIEFALTMRFLLGLPLRQTVEFVSNCFLFTGIASSIPDPSQISRREKRFTISPHVVRSHPDEAVHIMLSRNGTTIRTDSHFTKEREMYRQSSWCRALLTIDSCGGAPIFSIVSMRKDEVDQETNFHMPEGFSISMEDVKPVSDGEAFLLDALNQGMREVLQNYDQGPFEPIDSLSENVVQKRLAPLQKGRWQKQKGIFSGPLVNVAVSRHLPVQ